MTDEAEPPPIGRRARNRASRAAFVAARNRGLRERAAQAAEESANQPPEDLL